MSNVTDRRDGVSEGLAAKRPCRVVATSNITLSGTQTIDGVAVVVGERVLATAQTSAIDNGIWVVSAATWARAKDFDGLYDAVRGTQVRINSGTTYTGTLWVVSTADDFTIGTNSLSITQFTGQNGTNGATGPAGAGYGGTSATSLLIANSVTKTFTTQAGLAYQNGVYTRASSAANGGNYMEGLATYSGTVLQIAVTAISGSGTKADWVFSTPGTPGSAGIGHIDTKTGDFTTGGGLVTDTNLISMQQCIPGGRGSLTASTPVTTTDVTGATAVNFPPVANGFGGLVPLYDGTTMRLRSFLSSATDSAGPSVTLGANWAATTNYDWFFFNDSGTVRFLSGPAWSSDTARGTGAGTTELQLFNGMWTNKNSMTGRYANGSTVTVPANQGTFVTTTRTVAAGQCEDSMAKRFLYNAYNQIVRDLRNATETADNWTYTTATFRQAKANTANQLDVLIGLAGNLIDVDVLGLASNSVGNIFFPVGIGIDSTTTNSAQHMGPATSVTIDDKIALHARYRGYPAIGRHFYSWLEYSAASGTTTWYGDNGNSTLIQSGISGTILM